MKLGTTPLATRVLKNVARMPASQVNVKSKLAQLLASENIKVQHLPIKTAYFDLKERVLACPIWKDMDGDLYDLMMGHEVGHALHTDGDGWHGSIVIQGKGYRTYLNVVEDARIERLMKTKFPGLRGPFARAYTQLDERDFFQIRKRKINVNKLGMIDRLNIHFKLGHIYPVRFTAEEQTFVDRINVAETFEEVRIIADELYARAKKNKDKLPETDQSQEQEQDQSKDDKDQSDKKSKKQDKKSKDEDTDESDEDESGADTDESDEDESGADSDAEEGERTEDEDNAANEDQEAEEGSDEDDGEQPEQGEDDESQDSNSSESDEQDDAEGEDSDDATQQNKGSDQGESSDELPEQEDPTSETDEAFRDNEDKLVDNNAKAIRTGYLPDGDVVKRMISPMELVYTSIEDGVAKAFIGSKNLVADFAKLSVEEIVRDNKKYLDMLVKEFEMRKNASDYARQLVSKSGEIDDKQLAKYRFTSDIFRKVTTVEKGKSHGMMFFLDMSSSMQHIMGPTIKQMLVLVTFCKRVGIPFDVYGFADGRNAGFTPARFKWSDETIQCEDNNFHLKHLITSSCGSNEFRRAFAALAMWSNTFDTFRTQTVGKYLAQNGRIFSEHDLNMVLNGTPSNKMLMASRYLIEQFKNAQRVDIVNVVHLTDGEGTDHAYMKVNYGKGAEVMNQARTAYTDRKTMISVIGDAGYTSQVALTQLVAKVTGCRHIAFYVGDRDNIRSIPQDISTRVAKQTGLTREVLMGAWLEQIKEQGYFTAPNLGYDTYYYMVINKPVSDDFNHTSSSCGPTLEEAFIQHQKDKGKSRSMVRQFASEIAEQIKRN